ncbi:MAG: YCF48-related protein [Bacteroidota bacterium]
MKIVFSLAAVIFLIPAISFAQWELRYPDIPADQINDIVFLDDSTGFAVNSGGCVLKTTDGGDSWKIKAHFQREIFSEIKFLDAQQGFAFSPYSHIGDPISFIYTTDGGNYWNQGTAYLGDALTFLPVSISNIIKSKDNGSIEKLDNVLGLWTPMYTVPIFYGSDVPDPYGTVVQFQQLPGKRIVALGSSDRAKRNGIISDSVSFILKSDDAGTTWDTLWCDLPFVFTTLSFHNDSVGWMGGECDRIYKTTDGGISWIRQYSDSTNEFFITSISSPDGVHIFAVDGSGRVISSDNGGEQWHSIQVGQYYNHIFSITFLNSMKGFLAGPDFCMTADGGTSWKSVSKSHKGNFRKLDFVSEKAGLGVSGNSLYKTGDGGRSWNVMKSSVSQSFSGLDMLDSLTVWATGIDSVYHSTDGGLTWNSFLLDAGIEQIRGIQFLDSNTGVIFEVWTGDSTFNYVTTNGGTSWVRHSINDIQFFSSFFKIRFTDPSHLWFANQYGAWLSQDTAKTWKNIPVDGASGAFDFVDSLHGWLSIWGGQFKKLAYTNDGGSTWSFVDKPYSFQTQDMLTYRDGNYDGGIVVLEAGYDGSLIQYRQGDSYTNQIQTYTGQPLTAFATYRHGNTLHIWVTGDGMTVLHQTAYVTSAPDDVGQTISSFSLSQNYPNPFNPSTTFHFTLAAAGNVTLTVFDVIGRETAVLVSEKLEAGEHSRVWNASDLPSGIYFYRMQAGTYSETKKLLLLK